MKTNLPAKSLATLLSLTLLTGASPEASAFLTPRPTQLSATPRFTSEAFIAPYVISPLHSYLKLTSARWRKLVSRTSPSRALNGGWTVPLSSENQTPFQIVGDHLQDAPGNVTDFSHSQAYDIALLPPSQTRPLLAFWFDQALKKAAGLQSPNRWRDLQMMIFRGWYGTPPEPKQLIGLHLPSSSASAYLESRQGSLALGISEEVYQGLFRLIWTWKGKESSVVEILAFLLKQELAQSWLPRWPWWIPGATAWDRYDKISQIEQGCQLLKSGFLSKDTLQDLSRVPELREISEYVTWLGTLNALSSEKERRQQIQERAESIVQQTTAARTLPVWSHTTPIPPTTWKRLRTIPEDAQALLARDGLKVLHMDATVLNGGTVPSDVLEDPILVFSLTATIRAAVAFFSYAGVGVDSPTMEQGKKDADGSAVGRVHDSLLTFVRRHSDRAILVVAAEGVRDGSHAQPVARLYSSDYEKGYKDFSVSVSKTEVRIDHAAVMQAVHLLWSKGTQVHALVSDDLEGTSNLVLSGAERDQAATNSGGVMTLVELRPDSVHDFLDTQSKFEEARGVRFVPDDARIAGPRHEGEPLNMQDPFDAVEFLIRVGLSKAGLLSRYTDRQIQDMVKQPSSLPSLAKDEVNKLVFFALGPRAALASKKGKSDRRHLPQLEGAYRVKEVCPGLEIYHPGDGNLWPSFVALFGIRLDGDRRMVVMDRMGSAEAYMAAVAAGLSASGKFEAYFVSPTNTDGNLSSETARPMKKEESKILSDWGTPYQEQSQLHPERFRGRGVLAYTTGTGIPAEARQRPLSDPTRTESVFAYGDTLAEVMQRIRLTPDEQTTRGRVIINSFVVGRDGNPYVIRTTLESPDLRAVLFFGRRGHPEVALSWERTIRVKAQDPTSVDPNFLDYNRIEKEIRENDLDASSRAYLNAKLILASYLEGKALPETDSPAVQLGQAISLFSEYHRALVTARAAGHPLATAELSLLDEDPYVIPLRAREMRLLKHISTEEILSGYAGELLALARAYMIWEQWPKALYYLEEAAEIGQAPTLREARRLKAIISSEQAKEHLSGWGLALLAPMTVLSYLPNTLFETVQSQVKQFGDFIEVHPLITVIALFVFVIVASRNEWFMGEDVLVHEIRRWNTLSLTESLPGQPPNPVSRFFTKLPKDVRTWLQALKPPRAAFPDNNGVPRFLALLGRPGAGKDTHAPRLGHWLGVPVISMGDMVRRAARSGDFPDIQKAMDAGELINDHMIIGLLLVELQKPIYEKGYILNGFPRTAEQLKLLRQHGIRVDAYLNFEISPDTYRRRAAQRLKTDTEAMERQIEEGVPVTIHPRSDDEPAAVEKRLEEYEEKTAPVIGMLDRSADPLIRINTEDVGGAPLTPELSIERVFQERVLPALQSYFHRIREAAGQTVVPSARPLHVAA